MPGYQRCNCYRNAMRRGTMAFALGGSEWGRSEVINADLFLREAGQTILRFPGTTTMRFWIVACSALAVVAAHTLYSFTNRQRRRRGHFIPDQVSNEWLASAKIHEDHN